MTTAKKHLCAIVDKKLKKLLSQEGISITEFQEILKLDYVMKNESMCGLKKKESELTKIERLRKRLKI